MSKTTGIQWFVEPIGEYTNGVIADYLNQSSLINGSSSVSGHTYRKKSIDTFRVEREFALKLLESGKQDSALKFRIFYSRFGSRKITLWKNSAVIWNEKKNQPKTILELKDKVSQNEKEMTRGVEKIIAEMKKYASGRRLGKKEKYLPPLAEIFELSVLLSKNALNLENFLKK